MRVAVIGAGVAGLCAAKTLDQVGHDVVVYDKTPDVGGVWSETRRYPGLCTQSPRDTYGFSDFPMDRALPEWPSGEQVQKHLADYAERFGLVDRLRLGTEVVSVSAAPNGWSLAVRRGDGVLRTEQADHLVVANGVFSRPALPDFDGIEDFVAAGGRVVAGTEVNDVVDLAGRHVAVIGYGKSACDIAVAVSATAATTHVIARQLLWKVPRRVAGRLNFKHLFLTRLGEGLFRYRTLRGFERVLHGPANPIRKRMLASLGTITTKQYRLRELDLVPPGTYADIVRGAIGLGTEGFYEGVGDGSIAVHRDTTVRRLLEKDGSPYVELSDGSVVKADVVVCATGFTQELPFLPDEVVGQLRDERGNFLLYRHVHPVGVDRLSFVGYNSSFFSPLSAEAGAAWVAAYLAGRVEPPGPDDMRREIAAQLEFLDDAVGGHHCHGTKVIPFSLHNIDELLGDLGARLPAARRARQWLTPVSPTDFKNTIARSLEDCSAPAPGSAGGESASLHGTHA